MLYLMKCVGQVHLRRKAQAAAVGAVHSQPTRIALSLTRPFRGQHIKARDAIRRKHTNTPLSLRMRVIDSVRECPLDPEFVLVTFVQPKMAAVM